MGATRRRFLKGAASASAGALTIGGLSGGAAAQSNSDLLNGLNLPITAIVGESGAEITNASNPNDWNTVEFSNPLVQLLSLIRGPPVVLMKPASYRGAQPVHIRLRNVGTTSFEYKLEEWDYEDGSHAFEKMFWIAIAPMDGQIPTASGTALNMQTGRVPVDTNGRSVDFNLATNLAFQERPIALAQSQTFNGQSDSIITRVDGVENTGFGVRIQEQEDGDYHQTETVGYVATEVPAGGGLLSLGDLDSNVLDTLGLDIVQDQLLTEFEARRPAKSITDSPDQARRVPFTKVNNGDGFSTNPRVIADTQTRRGPQPANLRRTALTIDYMDLFVQEEQSQDQETNHANEDVGFLAFGGNGLIPGTISNINNGMP